jgi:hypothetical protein
MNTFFKKLVLLTLVAVSLTTVGTTRAQAYWATVVDPQTGQVHLVQFETDKDGNPVEVPHNTYTH